jgi:mannose-6-phosphate isomerase-like protein (cupin superfamily)
MASSSDFVVALPGECKEIFDAVGASISVQAGAGVTRGFYSLLEIAVPAATGGIAPPPPHIHHAEEEAWFILEGSLEFHIGEKITEAPVGSFVLCPRGTVHTFVIPESGARWLTIFSPSGMEGYFRDVAHRGETYATLAKNVIQEHAKKYNMEFI